MQENNQIHLPSRSQSNKISHLSKTQMANTQHWVTKNPSNNFTFSASLCLLWSTIWFVLMNCGPVHHHAWYCLKVQSPLTSACDYERHAWKCGETEPWDCLIHWRTAEGEVEVHSVDLLTNLVYTPRFSQAFISKAVQGPEVTFIQQGGSLYALGYTRDPRTEVNVRLLLLRLHNVMPSPQQLGIVCQTWEIPQWVRPENAAD